MLTPRLRRTRRRLEAKRAVGLTLKETELLDALRLVDRRVSAREFRALRTVVNYSRITSGPKETCPCCGRR